MNNYILILIIFLQLSAYNEEIRFVTDNIIEIKYNFLDKIIFTN